MTTFRDYPKGRLAQGSGDLIDVSDVSVNYVDGEKHVHTMRRNAAGSTTGGRAVNISFTTKLSEAGFERDWMGIYRRREVKQYRLKVPGQTFVLEGRLTQPSITSNVDGEITFVVGVVAKDQDDKS